MLKLEKLGFLTAKEAAVYMGIPRMSFYRMRKSPAFPKPVLVQNGMTIWKKTDIEKVKKTIGTKRERE